MVSTTSTTKFAPSQKLQQADLSKEAKRFEEAIETYRDILAQPSNNEEIIREQEYALSQLGQVYRDLQ